MAENLFEDNILIDKNIKFWRPAFLGVLIFLIIALSLVFYFRHSVGTPLSKRYEPKQFVVQHGEKARQISANLYKHGLISNPLVFSIYAVLSGKSGRMQAGTYTLSADMSMRQMLDELAQGKVVKDAVAIRIKEGWTIDDIGVYLQSEGLVVRQDFLNSVEGAAEKFDYFGEQVPAKNLEGYFFPDTYFVSKKAAANEIIEKILANTAKKISPKLRSEIRAQNKSIYGILTMASIIEREVGRNSARLTQEEQHKLDSERKVVSGIFYNRLKAGMLLQSDATIQFLTKKRTNAASAQDLLIDSPYNTYKYPGLPPGPISSPSMSSITAALYPDKTDYFYFLTKSDGAAVFAKTLDEQLRNKKLYLK